MAAETLTARELGRATLARQMLLGRERVSAVEAVERLCGMQAQEPRPPFAGLWTRVEGFDAGELREALRTGAIVRATLMRATLHLVSARDFRALRPPLQPAIGGALAVAGDRAKGVDPDALAQHARALLAAGPLTFEEIRASIDAAFPDLDRRVAAYAVRLHLPLTVVPTEDRWGFPREPRFALTDVDVGAGGEPDTLVRRYLAAYGPAAAADAGRWSGLKGLRAVLDRMRDELVTFRDERGRELFDLPDAPRPGGDVPAPPRFLPDFDQLLLAHDDRTRVIADEHRPLVFTRNLRIRATVLWDGLAVATWAIERRRDRATLTITPFGRLARGARTALAEEGERLLAFAEPDASARAVAFA